jgi:tRNA pseudouridine55 synthase
MSENDTGMDGLLIVDKPSGPTSHDVVAQARRFFGTRRVGHAGTLDPLATGVLVLLFGEATKLSDVAAKDDKTYVGELRFGRATDSFDAQGQTTERVELPPDWLDERALERALEIERHRERQIPPAVSAIKVAGRRAYDLARQGSAPALEPRPVAVRSLRVLGWSAQHAELELCVSKGYYVRSFARDVGGTLGVPAHLARLRRMQSGRFHLSDACPWPPTESPLRPRPPRLIPLREALPRLLPTWRLGPGGVERARHGKVLSEADFDEPPEVLQAAVPLVAWTDAGGMPVALGRREGDIFRVQRGFRADDELRREVANGPQEIHKE